MMAKGLGLGEGGYFWGNQRCRFGFLAFTYVWMYEWLDAGMDGMDLCPYVGRRIWRYVVWTYVRT